MKPIIIDNFSGISQSPATGFSDMRHVDIFGLPGYAQAEYKMIQSTDDIFSYTFTADPTSDQITMSSAITRYNGTALSGNIAVRLTTTGTLPAGLSTGTTYWIANGSSTTTFLFASLANAEAATPVVNITDAGTGVHTITNDNIDVQHRGAKHFAYDIVNNVIYSLDAEGKLWEFDNADNDNQWLLMTGNTQTNANGNGLVIWKNYLFVFRNGAIDVWGELTTARDSRTWTNGWQSISSTSVDSTHKAIVGQDDAVYFINVISNVPYIGSIMETTGDTFDPADSASYTFNQQALDLPKYEYINDIEEYGTNLMIATNTQKIYPWDRISSSFNFPIFAPEIGVQRLRTLNNVLYIAAGFRGNIYATQGTTVFPAVQFPQYISNTPINVVYVDSMNVYNGRLIMGIGTVGASGIYTFEPSTEKFVMSYKVSQGYGTEEPVRIWSLFSFSNGNPAETSPVYNTLHAGFDNDSNTLDDFGVYSLGLFSLANSQSASFQRADDYSVYFEDALRPIGTFQRPATLSHLSFNLAKPLAVGQAIRFSFRKELTSSYGSTTTFDFATYGAIQAQEFNPNIENAQFIQTKCELTCESNDDPTVSISATPLLAQIIIE